MRRELKILDDIMPEMSRKAAADDMHHLDGVAHGEVGLRKRFMVFCLGPKRQ